MISEKGTDNQNKAAIHLKHEESLVVVVPACLQNRNDWLTLGEFQECQRLVNAFLATLIANLFALYASITLNSDFSKQFTLCWLIYSWSLHFKYSVTYSEKV